MAVRPNPSNLIRVIPAKGRDFRTAISPDNPDRLKSLVRGMAMMRILSGCAAEAGL